MKFSVCLLEGFRDPLDRFYHFQTFQKVHIHAAGVSNQSQNGDFRALRNMDIQIHGFQPAYKMLGLLGGGAGFQNRDHNLHIS